MLSPTLFLYFFNNLVLDLLRGMNAAVKLHSGVQKNMPAEQHRQCIKLHINSLNEQMSGVYMCIPKALSILSPKQNLDTINIM